MKRILLASALALLFAATRLYAGGDPPKGFESLFNGKDLSGWKSTGNMKVWGAENGVIYCAGGGGGWLMTEQEYGDFELRLEYKMPLKGNSGVGIRAPLKGDPAYQGMEIQLIDDINWGKLEKWQNTGAIYNVVPPMKIHNKEIGEWNDIKITALGSRITVVHNGENLVDADLDDYIMEHSKKHPGILREKGHVGFQSYNKRVEFRNIYLKPLERRLAAPKHYNRKYHPWTPPTAKDAWEARKPILKEQLLVSQGLWPMPEKTPLGAVIHGKIERDGYTVEKVFFVSHPGHYVTGNLYRPTGKTGKLPAVLYTHGHWQDARLSTANAWKSDQKTGAEATEESSKYFHQAGCATLARLGCVVFHYDMVGNSDSKQIVHRQGFTDVDAQLRLQTFMNLQTWNSVRSVDFLLSLPEVDPARIGITGASGGGTQSFVLAAVDERVAASFPAVMVSTNMQGGCICENCAYLRVGTTNIELSALIAPRPLGMTGANDWTKEIETKGLPELKTIYKMYGAENKVMAKYLSFPHNYNQVSREVMYNFFNKHLGFGQTGTIAEKAFTPVPPSELSVYDQKHPLPKDAANAEGLKRYLTMAQEKQLESLLPKDAASLAKFQKIEHAALRAMMTDKLSAASDVEVVVKGDPVEKNGIVTRELIMSRKGQGERVKTLVVHGKEFDRRAVIWVHPDGTRSIWDGEKLTPAANAIVNTGAGILVVEPFRTGEAGKNQRPTTNMKIGSLAYAGYFYGYNRAMVAERVHDILTAVAFVTGNNPEGKSIHLVGFEKAGPWVVLARGLCGDAVERTAADLNQFRFEQIMDFDDEMMLPGALKYGGLVTLAGVIAPNELYLHNAKGTGSAAFLHGAYEAAGQAKRLQRHEEKSDAVAVVNWLLR
jgi:dienelactone hydrolase